MKKDLMPVLSHDLSAWFTPCQPALREIVPDVHYRQVQPALPLRPYIYSYWEFYTTRPLVRPFQHRIVADGCMAMIVNMQNPEQQFVRGFVTSASTYVFEGTFHYAGVCFFPGAFPWLLKQEAQELTNRFEDLMDVMPKVSRQWRELFVPGMSMPAIQHRLDRYFMTCLEQIQQPVDPRFFQALVDILQARGCVQAQRIDVGVSPRHLRRLFQFYIGDSPKAFANLVRFQNFIASVGEHHLPRYDKSYYDAGYYDQAHFIREFRRLYGVNPGEILKTG